jgi:hypothetical protein
MKTKTKLSVIMFFVRTEVLTLEGIMLIDEFHQDRSPEGGENYY